MTVCKFYLQGNCRYGDRCWNEHPEGESRRGATLRGDYYVSNDSRSLWRKDLPSPTNFSFKQTLSGLNTSNRFSSLSTENQYGSRRHSYLEEMGDDGDQGQQQYTYQGSGHYGRHLGNASKGFNLSHLHSANVPSQQSKGFMREPQFQGRPTVDFSFNAAHQVSQNVNRNPHPTPSFSFNAALNKQNQPLLGVRPGQARPNEPVAFSFKMAQNQLNLFGTNNNQTVIPPQSSLLFAQPTGSPKSNIFDRASTQSTEKAIDKDVPSILATSNILSLLSLYSTIAQLSDWEKDQFQAEKFMAGKIPTVPPPQELC